MTMDYGDDHLDAATAAYVENVRAASVRPRHARRVPDLVRRMAFWTLIFAVVYGVAAVALAVHPPTARFYSPTHPPTPSSAR